jgi:primase-polymerase (primpol)-like protein
MPAASPKPAGLRNGIHRECTADIPERQGQPPPGRLGAAVSTATTSNGQRRPTKQEIERAEEKPEALPVNPDGIPDRLKEGTHHVAWRFVRKDGKWTKRPVNPKNGRWASHSDPRTWGTYEQALTFYLDRKNRADGIGYVLSEDDDLAGVDFDDAVNPDTGELEEWAGNDIKAVDTYTEWSPTDTGAKAFLVGKKPGPKCKRPPYEVYDHERFFALTGHRVPGTPALVESRQQQLNDLYARLWPAEAKADTKPVARTRGTRTPAGWTYQPFNFDSDADLIAKARSATNGGKFSRLWDGDTSAYGGDDSAADAALCEMLAFWTRKDRDRMDRLFRTSGLRRDKWDERRGETTYGWMTIDWAIEVCTEVYSENVNGNGREGESQPNDDEDPDRANFTDVGNGKRLAGRHGADLRQCHPWKKWLVWDGSRWQPDATAAATSRAKETIASLAGWAADQVAEISKRLKEMANGKE